jgi:1-deoxy-D-xylulose 5-phosphate reductoisomerase
VFDEVVVESFLNGKLKFGEIPRVFEKVLSQYVDQYDGTLEVMMDAVKLGKLHTYEIVSSLGDIHA